MVIGPSEVRFCQSLVWLETELDDTKSWHELIIIITISENKYI